jgi:trimeric autotransporter adhesin
MSKNYIHILSLLISFFLTVSTFAQNLGINTTGAEADESAMVDIDSNNKGLLIPRVSLTSTTDVVTIPNPAYSLMVFNLATAGVPPNDVNPGYYYWDGTQWVKIGANAWFTRGNNGTNPTTNFLGTIDNQDLVIRTNDVERMRIRNTGNVGIATAAPGYQLQVDGSGTIAASNFSGGVSTIRSISNNWAVFDAYSYSASQHPAFIGMRSRGTNAAPTYPQNGDILLQLSGRDAIDGYIATGLHGGAGLFVRATQNWGAGAKGGEMGFFTTPDNSNAQQERMTLSSAGNLGIGTTTPTARLHVTAAGAGGQSVNISSPLGKANFTNYDSDNTTSFDISGSAGSTSRLLSIHASNANQGGDFNGRIVEFYAHNGVGHIIGFSLRNTGRVGIGTNLQTHLLELSQDDAAKPGTNTWTIVSDERFKQINGTYEKGLEEVLQLNPIIYHYINHGNREFHANLLEEEFVGFSAQEVQKIFPEAVKLDEDGFLTLNIHAILIAYTNAFKEQQRLINELKHENQELKLADLNYEKRIKDLESSVEQLLKWMNTFNQSDR